MNSFRAALCNAVATVMCDYLNLNVIKIKLQVPQP